MSAEKTPSEQARPPSPVAEILPHAGMTRRQAAILILCFIVYVLDGFDIVIIAFTAPAITADWSISPQQLGIVFSSGVLGMALGAMFLAPLADIYGRRTLVSLMLYLAGVATFCVTFTDSVTQLMVLRLVAGLGLGALVPALIPLTGDFSPRNYRTFILSLLFAGASVGPVIGGSVSAALIDRHGWQTLFQYAGLLTIAVGLLFRLTVPESLSYLAKRRPATAVEEINRVLARIGHRPVHSLPAAITEQLNESATVASLLSGSRRRLTLLTWTAFSLGFASVYFVTSWTPQILAQTGFDHERAIQGGVVLALGAIVGTPLFGWLARWFSLGNLVCIALAISTLGTVVLGTLLLADGDFPLYLLWPTLLLIGICLLGGFANLYTLVLTIYPPQLHSTGMGWASAFGRGGAVISPAVAGWLIAVDLPPPALFLCFAIPIAVTACCVLLVRSRQSG